MWAAIGFPYSEILGLGPAETARAPEVSKVKAISSKSQRAHAWQKNGDAFEGEKTKKTRKNTLKNNCCTCPPDRVPSKTNEERKSGKARRENRNGRPFFARGRQCNRPGKAVENILD